MFDIDEIIVERKRSKYTFSSLLSWTNSTSYRLCENSINLIFCMYKSIYIFCKSIKLFILYFHI